VTPLHLKKGVKNMGNFLETLTAVTDIGTNIADTAINWDISNRNLKLQQDHFDYQKGLQDTLFERQDNYFQRARKDIEAAGLNPLHVFSKGGSSPNTSPAISTSPPQRNYTSKLATLSQSIGVANAMAQLKKQNADISRTKAETARIEEQTVGEKAQNTLRNFEIQIKNKKFPLAPGRKTKHSVWQLQAYSEASKAIMDIFNQSSWKKVNDAKYNKLLAEKDMANLQRELMQDTIYDKKRVLELLKELQEKQLQYFDLNTLLGNMRQIGGLALDLHKMF
jgi:hypothetical protein